MQLPSFSASTDVNFAPFLAATGETATTARGAPTVPVAGAFGELLTDFAAPIAPENKPATAPADATTAMLFSGLPFTVVAPPPAVVDGATETIAVADCGADNAAALVADDDAGTAPAVPAGPSPLATARPWEKFTSRAPAPMAAPAPASSSTPVPQSAADVASEGETEVTDPIADLVEGSRLKVSSRAAVAVPSGVAPEIVAMAPLAFSPVVESSPPAPVSSASPKEPSSESIAANAITSRSSESFGTSNVIVRSKNSPTAPVGWRSAPLAGPAIDEATVATNAVVANATDVDPVDAIAATPSTRPTLAGDFASRYLTPTARQPLTPPPEQVAPDFAGTDIGDTRAMITPPVVAASPAAPVADELVQPPSLPAFSPQAATAPSVDGPKTETSVLPQNSAPADRAGTSFSGGGEKFAAPGEKIGVEKSNTLGAKDKTFLSAMEKRVTSAPSDLGTDVAKPSSAMSVPNYFDRPTTAAVLEHAPVSVAPVATVESFAPAAPLIASDATGAAHRAVDAVLTAAERFSSGDRHSVNLQFSVGGADLSVRVELLAGEVRTVFRTDSPELRAALAREWRAESNGAADRSLRLADPVFASANASGTGSFAGDNASRQHDSNARQTADEQFQSTLSRLRPARTSATSATAAIAASPRVAAPVTTLHLHALA